MAWATQYEIRFRDRHSVLWRTKVKKQGFTSRITVNYAPLYNWYVAAEVNHAIAAPGWHVPTAAEWDTLATYLGGVLVAGGKLKETGTEWWDEPNTGAANEVGFNGRGNGYRLGTDGTFMLRRQSCWFWTSDQSILPDNGVVRNLKYDNAILHPNTGELSASKPSGCSIRLVRDTPSGGHGYTGMYIGNDGKAYPSKVIGGQEWMAADLCETRFTDGSPIPIITDDATWAAATSGAMCAYNNNWSDAFTILFENNYGSLYNGYVAQDPRYFAPAGWHVPTQTEVLALMTELGGSTGAGAKLKEVGTEHWSFDPGSTNSSGFTALGAGRRDYNGTYTGLDATLHLLTSTLAGLNYYYLGLSAASNDATTGNVSSITTGGSIRLIKDDSTDPGIMTGNDGKQYLTVKIGDQVWMAENSCETQYRNGDPIPEITNQESWAAATSGAMCSYDNDTNNAYTEEFDILEAATEEPGQLEHLNESDRIKDPIKSSRLQLFVLCRSMFALADLYSEGDMHHAIELYQDDVLYWKGFVDPRQYEEAYGPVPYVSRITCTDGLTLLKNIPYEESDGVPYTGRKTAAAIVLDILGKIGHAEFKEYDNLYEVTMESDTGDSPWDQTSIDTTVFTSKALNCYEVLKHLLRTKNACIKQDTTGVFCIYRPFEIKNDTIYGRHFTSPTTKAAIELEPAQYINRPGSISPYRQMPGSIVGIQQATRKVTLTQDYGNKDNWLTGGEMKAEQYDGEEWEGWTRAGGSFAEPLSNYVTEERDGVIITGTNPIPFAPFSLSQTIATAAVSSEKDKVIVEFEYGYFNTGPIDLTGYAELNIEIKQGSHYLTNPDWNYYLTHPPRPANPKDLLWKDEPDVIRLGENALFIGFSTWRTFKQAVTGIPEDGEITIKLLPIMTSRRIYPVLKNIKIYVTSAEIQKLRTSAVMTNDPRSRKQSTLTSRYAYERIEVKVEEFIKQEYTATNLVNGEEQKEDFILGDVTDCNIDNVLEQFRGALASAGQGRRRDIITLSGSSGSAGITCNGVTRQIDFVTSLQTTAINWKFVYAIDYYPVSVIAYLNTLIFTHNEEGEEFSGDTTITNLSGDLQGTVATHQETIGLTPTTLWNRRGFYDNLPLLQIIANEQAAHGNRSRQFLDMTIMEMDQKPTELCLLGNLQDSINRIGNLQRSFLFARGVFRIRHRIWKMDLVESLALKPLTVDTTEITADSTTITVDQTHE